MRVTLPRLEKESKKCRSFQNNQSLAYFAIFYSMMCILNYALCFIGNIFCLYFGWVLFIHFFGHPTDRTH